MTEAQVFTALVACATGLGVAIWYLIRRSDTRLDSERAERIRSMEVDRKMFLELYERSLTTWMGALDKERESAKADRHEFRNEIAKWVNDLHRYKIEAAEKFVNYDALRRELAPIEATVSRVEQAVARIFERIDSDRDKHRRGDD